MQKNVREKDLKLFSDMAKEAEPAKPEDLSLRVLVPAFMISPSSSALSKSASCCSCHFSSSISSWPRC
jgi:flagellar biosynthesis protein FliP